ncbi:MAG: Uma2 family endonuclease [Gemmataceae bacterium]
MSAIPRPREVEYPSRDGKPMADNTVQFRWIQVLSGNLDALFRGRDDVFVGGDLLWYPVEGDNTVCQAPDTFVVFGRPKGDRPSYLQWEEEDVPMTVVFEILSPGNDAIDLADTLEFYDEHGVEEYYLYDPKRNRFRAYQRGQAALRPLDRAREYRSPRLGVRFDTSGTELAVLRPDGGRFLTFAELEAVKARLGSAGRGG